MNYDKPVLFGGNKPKVDNKSTLASLENKEEAKLVQKEAADFLLREQTNGVDTEKAMAERARKLEEYKKLHHNLN